MDPVTIATAVDLLLKSGAAGVAILRKTVPEYGKFWDKFEAQLKNEHDVPWDAIVATCHLQPSFIGMAIDYIAGRDAGRVAIEAHFKSFIVAPVGAREDNAAILARVSAAARIAANEAATSDRKAALANSELVIAAIVQATADLASQIKLGFELVETDLGALAQDVDLARAELAQATDEINRKIEESAARQAAPSIDDAQLEAAFERAAERFFAKQSEMSIGTKAEPPPPAPEARSTLSEEDTPVFPTTPGLEAISQQEHLDKLAKTDERSAEQITQIVKAGGTLALAEALRENALDTPSIDLLVTAARIVTKDGFLLEAEQAHLQAAELETKPARQARQFVRAARMADIQNESDRFRRHLERARTVYPDSSTLAITEARASHDSAYMLERVRDVEPLDDEERALLHQTRAQAHFGLGDEEAAVTEFELAKAASPTNLSVREFEAILALVIAQRKVGNAEEPDRTALIEAGAFFESLVEDLKRENRSSEAAQIVARAAQAFVLGHAVGRAHHVLERLPAPGVLSLDAAVAVGQAAMLAHRPDIALKVVPSDSKDPRARLYRAEAKSTGDDLELVHEGVTELDLLRSSDDVEVARQAAFSRLSASTFHIEVEWSDKAAQAVRDLQPVSEAALRAERHHLLGEHDQAEQALMPFAGQATCLRRLRDYAAAGEKWAKVADRSRQLIKLDDNPGDRLALAEALRHTDGPEAGLQEFLKLARDESSEMSARDAAYGAAISLVGEPRDYSAILELAREWLDRLPEGSNALWNVMFGLARLSEHAKALQLAEKFEPFAATPERATLLAEIYYRAAPRAGAVKRIVALSDQFDRKIEALEGLIIGASLGLEESGVGPGLEARIRDTFATFENRFPDSQTIRSFQVPESAEELEAFLREMAGDRPALQVQMADAVRDGRAPVNAFAAPSPHGVSMVWGRLYIFPLGFSMPERDEADREAAKLAIGGASVWDPSSLVVATTLATLKETLVSALPGSLVVNETLEDADAGALPSGKRVGETLHNAEGGVSFREISEEEQAAEEDRVAAVLDLAKRFEVRPAFGGGTSTELEKLYKENDGTRREFRVLVGTLALAQRSGRPVYSDDRWIREFARSFGVPAFGTLALLDVLLDQRVINQDQHQAARLELSTHGAWGVFLTRDELIGAGRADDFDLTRTLIGAFHDRASWRSRPAERFQEIATFLAAVHDERPDLFRVWVHRTLDAAQQAADHMPASWFADVLLIMSWGRGDGDPQLSTECFQALVDELKRLPPHLSTLGHDVVLASIDQMLAFVKTESDRERFLLFCLIVRRLRLLDAVRAIQIFMV